MTDTQNMVNGKAPVDPMVFQPTGERYTHFISTTNSTAKNLYLIVKNITNRNLPFAFNTMERMLLLENVYDQIEEVVAKFEDFQTDISKQISAIEMNGQQKKGVHNRDVAAHTENQKSELKKRYFASAEQTVEIMITTTVKDYLEQAMEASLQCEDLMKEITINTQQTRNFNNTYKAVRNIQPIPKEDGVIEEKVEAQKEQAEDL